VVEDHQGCVIRILTAEGKTWEHHTFKMTLGVSCGRRRAKEAEDEGWGRWGRGLRRPLQCNAPILSK